MEIKQLFENRLVDIVKEPSSLGNVAFADDGSGTLHLIWDVPFTTGVEASMFQRLFMSVMASVFYEMTGYSSQVSGEVIVINKPDYTPEVLAQSELYSFGNHFKGHVALNEKEIVDKEKFCQQVGDVFTTTLDELNHTNLKIRNY